MRKGSRHSEDAIKKISESMQGKNIKYEVTRFDKAGNFVDQGPVNYFVALGFDGGNIRNSIKTQKPRTLGGYIFKYAENLSSSNSL